MAVALKRNETLGLLLPYARPRREAVELAVGEETEDALMVLVLVMMLLLLIVIPCRAAKLAQVAPVCVRRALA
jgi:hypothetical protein